MAEVVVAESGQGRYQQQISAGEHQFVADEPAHLGGNDSGPNPFDLVMAGLGACTSITLRMYAERKGLPLTSIRVDLSHNRIDVDGQRRDHIERTIFLEGDLTPEQRQRLLEIANRCPVHRALSGSFRIDSRLAE